jgi:hypothetical protein
MLTTDIAHSVLETHRITVKILPKHSSLLFKSADYCKKVL